MMSVLQLKRDLTHDEPTLTPIAMVEEESSSELTPPETLPSLDEHHDRFDDHTKYLSQPNETDHGIDSILGTRSPITNMYHTTQLVLAEFHKELYDSGSSDL